MDTNPTTHTDDEDGGTPPTSSEETLPQTSTGENTKYLHIGGPHHNTWTTQQPHTTPETMPDGTTAYTHIALCRKDAINRWKNLTKHHTLAPPPQ